MSAEFHQALMLSQKLWAAAKALQVVHWNRTANWHSHSITLRHGFLMFSPVDLALFYPNVKICQTYLLYQVSGHEVEPAKGRRYCRLPNIPTSAEFFSEPSFVTVWRDSCWRKWPGSAQLDLLGSWWHREIFAHSLPGLHHRWHMVIPKFRHVDGSRSSMQKTYYI